MSSGWLYPSHRPTDDPDAVEFCALCGAPVNARDRILAIAQGLNQQWVCPEHWELAMSLSFNDLGGTGQAVDPNVPLLPHSGVNAFEED